MTHSDGRAVGRRTAVVGAAIFYVGDSSEDNVGGDPSPAASFVGSTNSLVDRRSPSFTAPNERTQPPLAAADNPHAVCDGQGGHHRHHRLDNGGHVDAAEEEETIKRRLKFFFMNPVEKYGAGGRLPWKLMLQVGAHLR